MRCPNSPGKGGFSNPGSSRPNLTHITVRGMMKTPGRCYDVLCNEYYKIAMSMSNIARTIRPPRAIFLGMQGNFSHPPLRALLEAGIEVCAVVIPAPQSLMQDLPAIRRREQPQASRSVLPVLQFPLQNSILQLAWERDIPRLGCLNVHPSLLPANRGPEPLFWTFREGSQRTGVTIHLIDEGVDTGPIVAQEVVEVPDGISYAQLEAQCAALGGTMLARSVWDLYNGVAMPVTQDETKSSYHGFPSDDDFVVPVAEWSARHVYNFICGVGSWGTPITLQVGNQSLLVKKAISYSHKDTDVSAGGVHGQLGEDMLVRCKEGWVR